MVRNNEIEILYIDHIRQNLILMYYIYRKYILPLLPCDP